VSVVVPFPEFPAPVASDRFALRLRRVRVLLPRSFVVEFPVWFVIPAPEPEPVAPDVAAPDRVVPVEPLPVVPCAIAHGSEIAAANVVIKNFFM
jgi:hypothetical protein